MIDHFGRSIHYMRISVTELCNLRCRYCMPEDGICKKSHEEMLTEDEIILAVRAAASLGIDKLRITGGEPLVRRTSFRSAAVRPRFPVSGSCASRPTAPCFRRWQSPCGRRASAA